MTNQDARKGVRVEFVGPRDELNPLGEQSGSALLGRRGTILYGISEDVFCYPDNSEMDLVWVAFDEDRMPRRQVFLAWLERVS